MHAVCIYYACFCICLWVCLNMQKHQHIDSWPVFCGPNQALPECSSEHSRALAKHMQRWILQHEIIHKTKIPTTKTNTQMQAAKCTLTYLYAICIFIFFLITTCRRFQGIEKQLICTNHQGVTHILRIKMCLLPKLLVLWRLKCFAAGLGDS